MTTYIGLDVHGKQTSLCALDREGRIVAENSVATTEADMRRALSRLRARPQTPIALETGVQAAWMADLLRRAGMAPRVVDAREVRRKARRPNQKSDRRDAFELADGLRRGIYVSDVWLPTPTVERLRAILSRRRHFIASRTRQINAAKFLLRTRGLRYGGLRLQTEKGWERLLARPDVAPFAHHLRLHHAAWEVAARHVLVLNEELREAVAPMVETYDLVQTCPGVGPITAATFIASVGDPTRFPDSHRLASYIGLVPSTYDSGDRQGRHGRITRQGSSALRAALCEAAQCARRTSHPLYPYYVSLAARCGPKRAIVAAAHRMAKILWSIWRHRRPFDLGRLRVEFAPGVRTKTVFYRFKEPAHAVKS